MVSYPAAPLNCYIIEEFHNGRQGLANGISALVTGTHGDHKIILVCTTELEDPLLILASYLTTFGGIWLPQKKTLILKIHLEC